MILRYITRTKKILEDCDEARTAFIQETENLENYIEHETQKKCFNAFLSGMISTALIAGGTIYIIKNSLIKLNSNRLFKTNLFKIY